MNAQTPETVLRRGSRALSVIEPRWQILLALLSALFVIVTVLLDWKKPLWNDELFTFYISRQSTLPGVWQALSTGAEQLPIFFFAIVKAFTGFLGTNPVALRLPETVGFLIMNVCIFLFLRTSVPASYAFLGFMFPAVTGAYYYACEARPYGLVMGFCGLALLSWRNAIENRRRPISLVALALFLACAINCHYYAVLLLFPFGLAELTRLLQRRRFDLAMYVALGASLLPLTFSLPLIRASSRFSSHFWARPSWTSLVSFYEDLLQPSGLALIAIALICGLALYLRPSAAVEQSWKTRPPLYEFALAAGFVLLPPIAIVLAKFVTGAFTPRYAIYAVIGFSMLLAWSFARMGAGNFNLGLLLTGTVVACWLVGSFRQYKQFGGIAAGENQTFKLLSSTDSDLPVVILSPHQFFVQSHIAETRGRGHFIYLEDVPLALKYTSTDTVERGLIALRNYAPLDVEDYHQFLATHEKFLAFGYPDPFGWVLEDLMQSGWRLTVKSRSGDDLLYLFEAPAKSALLTGSAR